MKDELSVVLVNYNYGDYLSACLNLLQKNKGNLSLDIWVVDNNSTDNSLAAAKKQFPGIHYIENKENLGFGAANNKAIKLINNELILLLNPDTKISSDTLPFMVDFMNSNKDTGAATCKGILENGQIDWGYHRGLPTPWASFNYYFLHNDRDYHLSYKNMAVVHEVDAISGSFFLTRKSVLNKVGLFDEDYWMYAEDIDLCYRMKQLGYKVMFVPNVTVTHIKGVSSGIKHHSGNISAATKKSKIKAFNSFYETMKIFYRKNLAKKYPFFIYWLVILGINIKWFIAQRKMKV